MGRRQRNITNGFTIPSSMLESIMQIDNTSDPNKFTEFSTTTNYWKQGPNNSLISQNLTIDNVSILYLYAYNMFNFIIILSILFYFT